jgi:hypothetical protein
MWRRNANIKYIINQCTSGHRHIVRICRQYIVHVCHRYAGHRCYRSRYRHIVRIHVRNRYAGSGCYRSCYRSCYRHIVCIHIRNGYTGGNHRIHFGRNVNVGFGDGGGDSHIR